MTEDHPHKSLYHSLINMDSAHFHWMQEAAKQIVGQPHSPMFHKFKASAPITHPSNYHKILQSGTGGLLADHMSREVVGSGFVKAIQHSHGLAERERANERHIPLYLK